MNSMTKKLMSRILRKNRVRARIAGTAERPRLSVFMSNKHVSAQIIDDTAGKTLASSTSATNSKLSGTMTEKAAWVGSEIAKKAKKLSVSRVAFDRGDRKYAGRLKALADEARKEGLEF